MATESDWFRVPEKTEQSEEIPHYTDEQTSAIQPEVIARYQSDNEIISIVQADNGKYFNQYGYDLDNGGYASMAGGFDTFGDAEKALYVHRPTAVEIEEEKDTPHYTVEQTSDAFADPFIIRDNTVPEGQDGQYYDVGGVYQTFETEEEAQEYADTLNSAEHITELFAAEDAERETAKQDNADLIGRKVTIDNRRYLIESVGEISGDVSLRDITFQNNVGFPINRVEKIGYIRRLLKQQAEKELPPEEKTDAPTKLITETVAEYPAVENGLPYDVVIQTIRTGEPELQPEKETSDTPVLSADRRNYRITDDSLGVGGAKEKFRNNMAAVNLLHELQLESRLATPEEQETLSKYVGWGGLSMAFDENNAAWADEFTELYASLSPEEYRAAKESTLTAFYTPSVVIKAMYEALDRFGFTQGSILDEAVA